MKKNTTQTPNQNYVPVPHKLTAGDKIIFTALILVGIGLFSFPARGLYKRFGPAPTVECNKCHHIVTKASAVAKKRFANMYGKDDKFKQLYFCQADAPAWHYSVGDWFFRFGADMQCNEDGSVISNIVTTISGWIFEQDSNGVMHVNERGTITYQTNIGGHYQAKHLDY